MINQVKLYIIKTQPTAYNKRQDKFVMTVLTNLKLLAKI